MGQSRRVVRPVQRWIAAVTISMCLALSVARAADISDRMSLIEAIDAVREQGIAVAYSSQLIKQWMRVRVTPGSRDPLVGLREALSEYQLDLQEGPGDRWLIVHGTAAVRPLTYTVSGIVIDARSREPLFGARVSGGDGAISTGVDGRFALSMARADDGDLLIVAEGYVDARESVGDDGDLGVMSIVMQPDTMLPLEEITIVSSRYSLFSRDAISEHFLTGDDIRLMPHIADDAFRAFHRLPGVAANDFQAPFNLRGGGVDEVKVILDGLELFEPYHMRTLFSPLSIIDPGIIGQAQVLSGGFTAEYGNQMSGVIDITSDRAGGNPVHELGVSFVSAFARSRGTFAAGRGSYQVSARRGYLDLIADTIMDDGEELTPRYSDIFASARYSITDSIDVAAHILSASDDVEFSNVAEGETFREDSSLNYMWVSVDLVPTEKISLSNTISVGRVETDEEGFQIDLPFEDISRSVVRDIGVAALQSDLVWQISDGAIWKAGVRYRNLSADFDYHIDSLRQSDIVDNGVPFVLVRDIVATREGEEFGAYAAFRFQQFESLAWELGLRWDKQTYLETDDDSQVSPRINGYYRLSERTDLRAGWGRYYQPQGIQDLQVQDGVTNYYPAQRAEHRVVGVKHRYESGIELQLDVYDKRYSDLHPRFENALDTFEFAAESNFDRIRLEPDSARSRGIELTLRKRQSTALDWWVNYTWSEAEDTFGGTAVPRSWDQRHSFTGNLTWQGDRWSISANARYHSGWPRTPLLILPAFDTGGSFVGADSDLSRRNSQYFDDYSRVDIRVSRTLALAKGDFEFYLEIFNIFDAKNQCCVPDHDIQFGAPVVASPNFDEFLPFFPSFGFVWSFGPDVD